MGQNMSEWKISALNHLGGTRTNHWTISWRIFSQNYGANNWSIDLVGGWFQTSENNFFASGLFLLTIFFFRQKGYFFGSFGMRWHMLTQKQHRHKVTSWCPSTIWSIWCQTGRLDWVDLGQKWLVQLRKTKGIDQNWSKLQNYEHFVESIRYLDIDKRPEIHQCLESSCDLMISPVIAKVKRRWLYCGSTNWYSGRRYKLPVSTFWYLPLHWRTVPMRTDGGAIRDAVGWNEVVVGKPQFPRPNSRLV